jgi:tRNA(adenine34) deaminase
MSTQPRRERRDFPDRHRPRYADAMERSFPASSAMARALEEARRAVALGEVPVGAVLTDPKGEILAAAHNRTRRDSDPTAHAEMLAIRAAAAQCGSERLVGCTLWVTLEPCAMCAGAISHARLARLVYAAADPKGGAVEHGARVFAQPTCHHRPEVVAGVGEREAAELLRLFFAARR